MIRELRTFLAVAEYGSFASAGSRIGLTQSAVSAQIARLEQELGYALFERTGRSAQLNAAGREALVRAGEILGLYRQLGQPGEAPAQGGRLRVGAVASVQASFMPAALASFRRAFPDCRVRIEPGVSLDLLGRVDAGEIDIAVMIRPPFALPAELKWRALGAEPFVLLAPAQAQGHWRELLTTLPFIRYDHASFGGRQVDQFLRRQRIAVNESLELDELQGMTRLVAQGLGVALAPRSLGAEPWPAQVREIGLGELTFHREIGLVERPAHARQALAGHLAMHIETAVAALEDAHDTGPRLRL
jgi:DNA-binding transcriptional LysR family regulator